MYITASHIQDSPWFNPGWVDDSFTLFKFTPLKQAAAGDGDTIWREVARRPTTRTISGNNLSLTGSS